MSSAWLLPEHIADVLPAQARRIEDLRRGLIDVARSYGCELVMPPLLEHLESLLSGANRALDLRTFKLVDQLSGRMLGVRADSTLQVARIDAHLLNRAGVTRLCYCGPVLHALPEGLHATREPLQFGAEIYGHGGLEADLEVQDLTLDCLRRAGLTGLTLDLGDARIVRALLAGVLVPPEQLLEVYAALAAKDASALRDIVRNFPSEPRRALQILVGLYGGAEVLSLARRELPARPLLHAALDDLAWLAQRVEQAHPEVRIGFDLADIGGNGYYSGVRFAAFIAGSPDAVARGGRYDEVGSAFGRSRAAVGFSLDLKGLAAVAPAQPLHAAIRAPWAEDAALRARVRALREQGMTVVRVLPGHEDEAQEFACDRELVPAGGDWVVRPL
ncbi:MAG: ATP phosphoribosyltransferase regulatory subunit [Pseudomonadota bacterium]|nr:ATP phosphoribosyltransferase regulatory subunit [Pseudomonadota bacterium]